MTHYFFFFDIFRAVVEACRIITGAIFLLRVSLLLLSRVCKLSLSLSLSSLDD